LADYCVFTVKGLCGSRPPVRHRARSTVDIEWFFLGKDMASCNYCGSTILFGGVTNGNYRFCNKDHAQKGALLVAGDQVPANVVNAHARQLRDGNCPRCNKAGPVEVRNSYYVQSFILMTSWRTNTHVCCKPCGRKQNLKDGLLSLVLGWWGLPWGLLVTPIQVIRNLIAAIGGDSSSEPSPALLRVVRAHLASRVPQAQAQVATPMDPARVPPAIR
jgi:hypothetical protein